MIQPEDCRLRTSGIRHRKVKQRRSRAIYKNKWGLAGKCNKELSQENRMGVRSPERKNRARSKKGEEEVM